MGGEKDSRFHGSRRGSGSPPHGRGKVGMPYCSYVLERITPAWAGKSTGGTDAGESAWDHPRMGGEKSRYLRLFSAGAGSPPHGRGKGPWGRPCVLLLGITPAWAGKRPGLALLLPRAGDHPRMGGEKFMRSLSFPRGGGSPPHGRGKEVFSSFAIIVHRITPAWAGKSNCYYLSPRANLDHPRMGGEKAAEMKALDETGGSPPHGRGKG